MSKPLCKVTLSKLEVARKHLDAAIDLWFQGADPVPIHTLACAAHEVFAQICEHRKLSPLAFDPSYYREGMAGLARKVFHKHYNFFKHADKDPEGVIEFPPEISEFFIYLSIEGWRALGGGYRELDDAFILFLMLRRPELHRIDTPQRLQQFCTVKEISRFFAFTSRTEFLSNFRAARASGKPQPRANQKQ